MPQGSNPSWVSKEQLGRLEPLLKEWPEPDVLEYTGEEALEAARPYVYKADLT
jgi:hypothetical protein